MRLIALTIAIALCAQPSLAGQTPWQEVAPGVSVRLISAGAATPDGRVLVGLEIDMPATTKTYWRVPGETGIPTQIDVSRSHGIAGHRVLWPYPTIDTRGGYLDYAYFGPTVLPVELQLKGETADLEVAATLGICAEICIPVAARFELPLGGGAMDRANGLRLRQAVAMAPVTWDGEVAPLGDVRFDAESRALVVDVAGSGVDPASLIGAFRTGGLLVGAPQPGIADGSVRLPLIGSGDGVFAAGLAGQVVDLVFRTPRGAFSLSRRIVP